MVPIDRCGRAIRAAAAIAYALCAQLFFSTCALSQTTATTALASMIPAAQRAALEKVAAQKMAYGELAPVYRFYNKATRTHFYTISEAERGYVNATLPDYNFEGPVFSAYPAGQTNALPVYRFWNTATGTHFYTISLQERDQVLRTLPRYAFEGMAYYAFTDPGTGLAPVYRFYNTTA